MQCNSLVVGNLFTSGVLQFRCYLVLLYTLITVYAIHHAYMFKLIIRPWVFLLATLYYSIYFDITRVYIILLGSSSDY